MSIRVIDSLQDGESCSNFGTIKITRNKDKYNVLTINGTYQFNDVLDCKNFVSEELVRLRITEKNDEV